ncbi:MAG: hypothetical protein M1399_01090 [Actinobacteria bacterium]|nr:hypothetical protein [Actinomycetota bacterium]MCL5446766.1 hypothetical protein [Actinomycetota bacterium]
MLECVINISEGCNEKLLGELCQKVGEHILDMHSDRYHNRTVVTLAGTDKKLLDSVHEVALWVIRNIDITSHHGVHPRLGALDVVPFVPLGDRGQPAYSDDDMARAIAARNSFSRWLGRLGVPCFKYGPDRSLPEIRKGAFTIISPDDGPSVPHPTAGACCIGARPVLIAYNVWLTTSRIRIAHDIASRLRSPSLRTLGLPVGDYVQVSCNIVDTRSVRIDSLFDQIDALASIAGVGIYRAELVGLMPQDSLRQVAPGKYHALDIDEDRTIENRLARTS